MCFNLQEVIYPWYICCWFGHCAATSRAQIPALDPCPPSHLLKLGGCIREEKHTPWEERGHCFGFCFFNFPGSAPYKLSTLNTQYNALVILQTLTTSLGSPLLSCCPRKPHLHNGCSPPAPAMHLNLQWQLATPNSSSPIYVVRAVFNPESL